MASTTTVRQILVDALSDCGAFNVGMPPAADAINKALRLFNFLLSSWNVKRYMIPYLKDTSYVADGSLLYTVGPGGQFPLDPRPDKLSAAFMRQLNASPNTPVDYSLRIIDTWEDYSRISIKHLATWTQSVFFDPIYPTGKVYPWPIMQANFELHLVTKSILQRYDDLNAQLGVPEEYEEAFYQVMKVRLGASYRLTPNPVDVAMAKVAMATIRGANSLIAGMKFPRAVRATRRRYNIYSDNN